MTNLHLGFEIGTGKPVEIPLKHTAITGQTQEAGKTTALEALIGRGNLRVVAFVTKRGEGSFTEARRVEPYFREQADWQFVASILEASRGEKLKFERAWIIRASRGARTLADVQRNVRVAMVSAKGMSADVYLTLDAYLEVVVPQIGSVQWASKVELRPGVNAMDLTDLSIEMQHLVIKSTLDWVLKHEKDTVVVVPEAWKFIPQGRGTPVKLAAEAYIRQGAALRNYLWLDSQDIAGIDKIILKSVPVWILGVQRETNEIKRTLDNIPAGTTKPSQAAIATLEVGQFFACWGRHCVATYAQPMWLTAAQAKDVALGKTPSARPVSRKESEVTKEEAGALRAENADLKRRLLKLEGGPMVRALSDDTLRTLVKPEDRNIPLVDIEFAYEQIVARLKREAPALLKVLAIKPEIEITVERRTISIDGSSLKGRIAQLIAEGFFDGGKSQSNARTELKRRGSEPNFGTLSREMASLHKDGFLVRESDDSYHAVEGMRVNIV
jgi:hypothetical protein